MAEGETLVKKKLSGAVLLWMVFFVFTGCKNPAEEVIYTAGTYSASVPSVGGPLTVNAEFSATDILALTVSHTDTLPPERMETLVVTIRQGIIAAQSTGVDALTGATVSSNRIKNAVEECMEQARLVKTGILDGNLYHFINNSGYPVTVRISGDNLVLPPGANETVVSPGEPAFSVSGGSISTVKESRCAVFYNMMI
jgi:uncharacterized protein with FMN-binding domain